MGVIRAVYQVTAREAEIAAEARAIALEQTVEVPEAVAEAREASRRLVGRVEAIEPLAEGGADAVVGFSPEGASLFRVTIAYDEALACGRLNPLLNLLSGNVSIKPNIRLVDFELPASCLVGFGGPKYGIDGVRARLGVYGRPLMATALKPRGLSPAELAEMAREFALGGGDLIKDDHNLVDSGFEAFRERVLRCGEAVGEANDRTGRLTLYLPHLISPREELERAAEFLALSGLPGALVEPQLLGLDAVRSLAARYPLIFLAHPALTGSFYLSDRFGIAPGLAVGKLYRLAGCDGSIFPNPGGRFALTWAQAREIADALRGPWGGLRPAWPVPAGGMSLERVPEMAEAYGPDALYLIGGALLAPGESLRRRTEAFLRAIGDRFREIRRPPAIAPASACEMDTGATNGARPSPHLPFEADRFAWAGRPPSAYKASPELPFQGVTRHELIGPSGERTAFDLRYFQIAPGGFTSRERHAHTHTIICLRGRGTIEREGQLQELKPFDIAYIDSLETHQLRNEGSEPFGFFCIVDRQRDRPMPPAAAPGTG